MTLNKGRVPVKVFTHDIEPEALQQLLNVASLPIVFGHVAAMPDVHHGIGATVGNVVATKQAIIPAAVGVDIDCGMNGVRLLDRREAERLATRLSDDSVQTSTAMDLLFANGRKSVSVASVYRQLNSFQVTS
jgi:RNA-splicing ligase RtcB